MSNRELQSCAFLNSTQGNVDRYVVPSYVPATYGDNAVVSTVSRPPPRGAAPPTLKELMQEKEDMTRDLERSEELRRQYLRAHRQVLGVTPDLCRGALDDLLAETRRLTARQNENVQM